MNLVKVSELIQAAEKPLFSFEFFPPKGAKGADQLVAAVRALRDLSPAFVSMTCGAGGSAHRQTVDWAKRIEEEAGSTAVVHQTSYGFSVEQIDETLAVMQNSGLANILALRGDMPSLETQRAFDYADGLVRHVRTVYPSACVLAACYPEGHLEAPNRAADLDNLKRKVDAGVDVLVTQLFFDNAHYFEFLGRLRSKGITIPVVPGIMPIHNVAQIKRFTSTCGASIPPQLLALLDQYQDVDAAVFHIGVAHAISQCAELLDAGVPGIHFYTLNRSSATRQVVEALR